MVDTHQNSIADSVNSYMNSKQAFVFYRKTETDKVVALIQKDSQLHTVIDYNETGFVFAPFNCSNNVVLLPCSETKKEFFTTPNFDRPFKIKDYKIDEFEKKKYEDLVKKTVSFIQDGKADKVVTSRKIEIEYDKLNIGILFENLLIEYPQAMVYVWYHPKVGLWLGATPEKILYVHKNSFSTMALAGTQLKANQIDWKLKEKEEQQFVTDFITDQLIPIANQLEISEPYTEFAGHLAHLRTDIKGTVLDNISLKDLIFRVHPTPAVCGTPRNGAKEFILQNEGYERAYYAGFLGELMVKDNTDLYVNLRCMQLDGSKAKIYIGGGITKDSEPEKEWEETYQKSLILAKFLL